MEETSVETVCELMANITRFRRVDTLLTLFKEVAAEVLPVQGTNAGSRHPVQVP